MTLTTGTDWVSVHSLSLAWLTLRFQRPLATTRTTTRKPARPAMARPRRGGLRGVPGGDSGDMRNSGGASGRDCLAMVPVNDAEHDRHEDERGDRRKNQAADDGAAERRVLLAALAQAQRHRRHADDHGKRGHENRPEAHIARVERGRGGVAKLG